jgi:predicted AlkP superfamily pyrophosphatase or phosphodiesterase
LAGLRLRANLVVVSDHGMAALSPDRVIDLGGFAPAGDWTVVEDGPYVGLNAVPGREAALANALAHPPAHVRCWPKAAIPARFRYGHNPRIPQFLCLADPGWLVLAKAPAGPVHGGNHGYDNAAPEMQALFIGSGPGFRPGVRLTTFDNLAIEPLLRRLLGLPPGANRDGSLAPLRRALRNR